MKAFGDAHNNAIKTLLWMAFSTGRDVGVDEFEEFYEQITVNEFYERFLADELREESSWPFDQDLESSP